MEKTWITLPRWTKVVLTVAAISGFVVVLATVLFVAHEQQIWPSDATNTRTASESIKSQGAR